MARCPAHSDEDPSLSIAERDGKILVRCFAGCSVESVVAALGLRMRDLFEQPSVAALQGCGGGKTQEISLASYAEAKRLPVDFLTQLGVSERKYYGRNSLRMAYFDESGLEIAKRFRIALYGDDKFRWASGSKVMLYGLESLLRPAGLGMWYSSRAK